MSSLGPELQGASEDSAEQPTAPSRRRTQPALGRNATLGAISPRPGAAPRRPRSPPREPRGHPPSKRSTQYTGRQLPFPAARAQGTAAVAPKTSLRARLAAPTPEGRAEQQTETHRLSPQRCRQPLQRRRRRQHRRPVPAARPTLGRTRGVRACSPAPGSALGRHPACPAVLRAPGRTRRQRSAPRGSFLSPPRLRHGRGRGGRPGCAPEAPPLAGSSTSSGPGPSPARPGRPSVGDRSQPPGEALPSLPRARCRPCPSLGGDSPWSEGNLRGVRCSRRLGPPAEGGAAAGARLAGSRRQHATGNRERGVEVVTIPKLLSIRLRATTSGWP